MRFLIIKFGEIGDVVMTLPLIQSIRRNHPGAHITYLVGKSARPILDFADIDKIIAIDQAPHYASLPDQFRFLRHIWRYLAFRSYDHTLTLYRDPRYRLLTLFTFGKKSHPPRKKKQSDSHITDLLRLINPGDLAIAWPNIPHRAENLGIVLALGGTQKRARNLHLRSWPPRFYAQLAQKLVQKGHRVFITGSKEDKEHAPLFENLGVENLIGKLTLDELVHLIGASQAVVTHDGGALHIAQACQKPTLALFGPTDPAEFVTHPNTHILWGGRELPCSPCYDGRTCSNCAEPICMKRLTPDLVCESLCSMIG